MTRTSDRPVRGYALAILIAGVLCFATFAPAQEKNLPAGFGDINIGDAWKKVSRNLSYEIIDSLATPWDLYLNQCGYVNLRVGADRAELLCAREMEKQADLQARGTTTASQ